MPAAAYRRRAAFTVHPGIGYDIIVNHPHVSRRRDRPGVGDRRPRLRGFGRSAGWRRTRFHRLGDHGPANLREGPQRGEQRPHRRGPSYLVEPLPGDCRSADGGGWDWTRGEPPKTNPAYYLRFCKTFYRMGGTLDYIRCDNRVFLAQLLRSLGIDLGRIAKQGSVELSMSKEQAADLRAQSRDDCGGLGTTGDERLRR